MNVSTMLKDKDVEGGTYVGTDVLKVTELPEREGATGVTGRTISDRDKKENLKKQYAQKNKKTGG